MSLRKQTAPAGQAPSEALAPLVDLGELDQLRFVERDGAILLVGSESASSGVRTYPAKAICPDTGARDMRPFMIGPCGSLYAFSEVHVSSSRETPYTIGYVDFPQGVRVLASVRGPAVALDCDMLVVLQADGKDWFVAPLGPEASQ